MRMRAALVSAVAAVGLVACSSDSSSGSAAGTQRYENPKKLVEALNAGGFECIDAEFFDLRYPSTGQIAAAECRHDDNSVTVLMIPLRNPPVDLLNDVSERIVAGPNWIVGTSELTELYRDIQVAIGGELVWDNGPLSDSPSTPDVPATTTTGPASTTTTPPTTLPSSPPTEPAQTSTIPTSSADYTITGEPNLDSEVAAILDGAVAGAEQEYGFNVTDRECSDTDIGDLNASCGLTLDDGSYGLLDIYIAPGGNYSWEFFSD